MTHNARGVLYLFVCFVCCTFRESRRWSFFLAIYRLPSLHNVSSYKHVRASRISSNAFIKIACIVIFVFIDCSAHCTMHDARLLWFSDSPNCTRHVTPHFRVTHVYGVTLILEENRLRPCCCPWLCASALIYTVQYSSPPYIFASPCLPRDPNIRRKSPSAIFFS